MKRFILLFLILLFTSGCVFTSKSSDRLSEEVESKFNQECIQKADELDKLCIEENISSLDLGTLGDCSRITSNREYFLENCDFDFLWDLDVFFEELEEPDDIFYNELKSRCDRPIGEMTIKEFNFCMSRFGNLDVCQD